MTADTSSASKRPSWRKMVSDFESPDQRRAVVQILNSFLPYFALWGLMVWAMDVSYWLVLALAIPAGGFLIRTFIITHDCGHGAFIRNRRVQNVVGYIGGLLTFTPYYYWSRNHAVHHATAGNLDRRGVGDVWTMTLKEYQDSSRWGRIRYRVFRNPFIMLVIGPAAMFLLLHRFAKPSHGWRWQRSVLWSNVAIAGVITAMTLLVGFKTYALIQLPVILIAGLGGVWLFYVQHQFENIYWARTGDWSYAKVGLEGSSYYRLPKILQWFSGNIGFHHVHHLSPKVPNYKLESCHDANPRFHRVPTVNLRSSLRCLRYRVYDEDAGVMVGLGAAGVL